MWNDSALIIAYSLGLLTIPFIEYIAIPHLFPMLKAHLKEWLKKKKEERKPAKKKRNNKKKGKNKERVVKRTTVTEEYEDK